MPQVVIAPVATQDIESILRWTHEQFGEQTVVRYEALLVQAIMDISRNPDLPGSSRRSEIARAVRTYHLIHSRDHVASEVGRVKHPRHFLIYRTRADRVEIGRVLHESMDVVRHLPDEYQFSPGKDDE